MSALASLAAVTALAGCSGSSWQFWKTSSSSTATQPVVTAPAEPTGASAAAAPPTAHPAAAVETPAMTAPPTAGFMELPELADVRFRPGQVTVARADHKGLDAVARWLKERPSAMVMIEGHTDDLGTPESNLVAAEKRAESVKAYLIGKGIDATRISITPVGAERPVCLQKTDACRARNRRTHFLVSQP